MSKKIKKAIISLSDKSEIKLILNTLKKYGVRFTSQVWPGDTLESEAKIVDIREENGENLVDLEIVTTNQDGVAVITGSATAKIDS